MYSFTGPRKLVNKQCGSSQIDNRISFLVEPQTALSPDTQLESRPSPYFLTCPFSALCAAGYTRTDLKGLELGKEELHVLELKLKALIMDCIHFIDVVQQLLAADTRSTQEWQWQKQLR